MIKSFLHVIITMTAVVVFASCDGLTGEVPEIYKEETADGPSVTPAPQSISADLAAGASAPADVASSHGLGGLVQSDAFASSEPLQAEENPAVTAQVPVAQDDTASSVPALTAPDPALAESPSLYLRQAAEAPVHWRSWGDAAFQEAAARRLPVLLVIGASWSHDAHVLDADVFPVENIATTLNSEYVPIRVDSDERPDIWARYRLVYELINQKPASPPIIVFALADGRPFDVVSAVPATTTGDTVGLSELLDQATQLLESSSADAVAQADQVEKLLADLLTEPIKDDVTLANGRLNEYATALADLAKGDQADSLRAGRVALVLLTRGANGGNSAPRDAGSALLLERFRSGQRDHVMGGYFFRVPGSGAVQFGKIQPVQAEMIAANSAAFAATGKTLHKEAVTETLRFTRDFLEAPEGGFYSSQNPDAGPADNGGYFTWTAKEIRDIAGSGAPATVFITYLNAEDDTKSNLHVTGRLQQAADAAGVSYEAANRHLDEVRMKLHEHRMAAENVPLVDKTLRAGWTGDMICAYLDAAELLGDDQAKEFALKSADRLIEAMVSESEGVARMMYRTRSTGFGFLEDNVKVAAALLRCHEVSGHAEYLESAESLMAYVEARFLDAESGLYRDVATNEGQPGLMKLKRLPIEDDIARAPNAVAAMNWVALAKSMDKSEYRDRAERMIKAALLRRQMKTDSLATWAVAADRLLNGKPAFKQ